MKRLILIVLLFGFHSRCTTSKNVQYLEEIKGIDRWLQGTKVELDGSHIWPNAIDKPDQVSNSLSDGVAGKLVFYLQAHIETGSTEYLQEAREAAHYLLDHLPQKKDSLHQVFWAFSPYGHVCGAAFALLEIHRHTGEDQFKYGAEHIIDIIEYHALNKADTVSWGLGNDVLGGLAGTGLFLLYAGEVLQRNDLVDLAQKAGKTLIARANKEIGFSWKRGQDGRFNLPNFSHGAAGIGYFLARLFETTKDDRFLAAALEANKYLESIALTDHDVFLIPYGFPDPGWSRPFDVGWAHGPAGVARFYRQLYKVTLDEKWIERENACLRGIRQSGIPGKPVTDDFGQDEFYLDNRFGIGSVANFVLDIELNDQFDAELINYILSKGLSQNEELYWPQTRYGFMTNAGDTTAFTGLFYGASGYGMLLLKSLAKSNGTDFIRFVDDPYRF